jgi:glycosyltransferase involved in cell wall biosynthesis
MWTYAQGGAQRVALSIAEGFPGSGVAALEGDGSAFLPLREEYDIPYYMVTGENEIVQIMEKQGYDILHIHWWHNDGWQRVLDLNQIDRFDFPVVITMHEMSKFPHMCDNLIAITPIQKSIQEFPCRIIKNGFNLDGFRFQRNYSPPRLCAGFVSRLDQKLHRDSMAILKKATKTTSCSLTVVGDGTLKSRMVQEAHSLSMSVNWQGNRWDVNEALKGIDIFVYPTNADVLPTVIIEAMASGIPVVAPPIGDIPILLADGRGYCVEFERFKSAVVELTNSTALRRQMGAKAQEFAFANYSHESMLTQYGKLYSSLLGREIKPVKKPEPAPKPDLDTLKMSIVIPTYKRPELALRAAKAALAQNIPNVEVIVVNDGDHESDYSEVKKLGVKYIEHEVNSGLSAARNTGIKASTGDYVGFCDDDDYWYPFFAKHMLLDMVTKRADVAYGTGFEMADGRKVKMNSFYPFSREKLLRHNYIVVSGTVIRGAVIREELFDEELHKNGYVGPEDWELWLRLSQKGFRFIRSKVVGLVYNPSAPDRLTAKAWNTQAMQRGYAYINHKLGLSIG